jgi:uncharacterized lipoprotein YddW (UPF0748 family)
MNYRIASPFAACLALFGYQSTALAATPPKDELRGIWVVCYSLNSPQAVRNVVKEAKAHRFNSLFVQVRSRGDAWYDSTLEPRAKGLAGTKPGFDPLQSIIEEGHKNGLKVHAWLNTFLVWTGKSMPTNPNHILNAHPDWIARDRNNHFQIVETSNVEGAFMQPSNPEVQEHLYKVFTDVATRYDVDGIHFDFVRYAGSGYDFAPGTLKRFAEYMEPKMSDAGREAVQKDGTRMAYVHMFSKEWTEWRKQQVTDLVARISDGIHTQKPEVEISAAVFANATDALTERGQDWPRWLREGYLDAICPMAYSTNTDVVAKQIASAVKIAGEKHVYAGLGSWRLSPQDTAQKINRVRSVGAKGVNIFSYGDITRDGQNMSYLDSLSRSSFASRAGVPPMRWRQRSRPDTESPSK